MQYCKNRRKEEVMILDENQNKDDLNTGKYKTPQESLSSEYFSDIGLDLALKNQLIGSPQNDLNTGKYAEYVVRHKRKRIDLGLNDYLLDVGIDVTMPTRIRWTEWLPNGDAILHYSMLDEYNLCGNHKEYQ